MKINIIHTGTKVVVHSNIGLQGAKGTDAIPVGGNTGDVLVRTSIGVGWTPTPDKIILNGGTF